jgi:hypothetical protein
LWTGLGACGTAILGMAFYNEPRDLMRLACLTLIVAGTFGLKLSLPSERPSSPAQEVDSRAVRSD